MAPVPGAPEFDRSLNGASCRLPSGSASYLWLSISPCSLAGSWPSATSSLSRCELVCACWTKASLSRFFRSFSRRSCCFSRGSSRRRRISWGEVSQRLWPLLLLFSPLFWQRAPLPGRPRPAPPLLRAHPRPRRQLAPLCCQRQLRRQLPLFAWKWAEFRCFRTTNSTFQEMDSMVDFLQAWRCVPFQIGFFTRYFAPQRSSSRGNYDFYFRGARGIDQAAIRRAETGRFLFRPMRPGSGRIRAAPGCNIRHRFADLIPGKYGRPG